MKPRPLQLSRQTLRSLSDRALATVAGGGPQPIGSNNPQHNCQMPKPPWDDRLPSDPASGLPFGC
jgi:hypothetical protein